MIFVKKNKAIIFIILILIMILPAFSYAEKNTVTISLAGDVLLGSWIGKHMETHGVDYPWESVSKVFLASDLSLVNLECSVGTVGEAQEKEFTYRANPETLQGLVNAGVKGVNIGNNHTLDFGRECFVQTLDNLERHNIKYTGGGRDINVAYEPAIWEINGIKIGFIGFSRVTPHVDWYATEKRTGTVNGYDGNAKNMIKAVQQAKKKVDFLIVSFHWGIQLADYPRDNDVAIAKELIDSGADCIMGHHPHVLQGIEFYKDRPIVYSLGNFIFGSKNERTSQTMIFKMEINKDGIINTNIIPGMIKSGKPVISEGEDKEKIINLINELSADWGTKVSNNGNITGNIEYVSHAESKTEKNEENRSESEDLSDDTGAFNDNITEYNNGKSTIDIIVDFLTEYGLEVFIISGVLSLLLLIVVVKVIK